MINTVNALILSEMFLSPLLRYLDVPSFVNRHYFAPRAKTQEDMYNCFMGGFYNLGERFTVRKSCSNASLFFVIFINST